MESALSRLTDRDRGMSQVGPFVPLGRKVFFRSDDGIPLSPRLNGPGEGVGDLWKEQQCRFGSERAGRLS